MQVSNEGPILVVRPDNIGVVVMTGPAVRALRAAWTGSRIVLLASPAGSQAVPLLPWFDDVIVSRVLWQDLGRLDFDPAREWALIERLRQGSFSKAFIFTSFSQTPLPAALACYLAGIPVRIGRGKETGGELLSSDMPPLPDDTHQVERNLSLVEAAGVTVKDRTLSVSVGKTARASARVLLHESGLVAGEPFILLAPWASCEARTYEPRRFAAAAKALAGQLGGRVVVTGAPSQGERAGAVMELLGDQGVNMIGKTTIPELTALVGDARLVLTNHTLTMHLADALRTPSVTVFSGSDLESQWRPRHSPFLLLRRHVECAPCYAFTCPLDRACMEIPPEEVAEAGLEVLRRQF